MLVIPPLANPHLQVEWALETMKRSYSIELKFQAYNNNNNNASGLIIYFSVIQLPTAIEPQPKAVQRPIKRLKAHIEELDKRDLY